MVAIGNGDGPPQLDAGIQLAEKYPFMYATIGIHPHEARLASDHAYSEMEQLARHPGSAVPSEKSYFLRMKR